MTMLPHIAPREAASRMRLGGLLIDIREADEFARSHIPGAVSVPLSRLEATVLDVQPGRTVLFHCRSGARTEAHAARLAAKAAGGEVFVLEGGLDGWRAAGLEVVEDRRQPLELMRQVQIAAGSLVLAGAVLGATVSPWFYLLSGFVGAGLVFAGISGTCGMALLLRRMPWNRPLAG